MLLNPFATQKSFTSKATKMNWLNVNYIIDAAISVRDWEHFRFLSYLLPFFRMFRKKKWKWRNLKQGQSEHKNTKKCVNLQLQVFHFNGSNGTGIATCHKQVKWCGKPMPLQKKCDKREENSRKTSSWKDKVLSRHCKYHIGLNRA